MVLSEIKLKRTDTTLDLSQLAKRAKEEREKKIYKDGGREGRYLYVQGGERPGAQSVNSAGPAPLRSALNHIGHIGCWTSHIYKPIRVLEIDLHVQSSLGPLCAPTS